jgi:hypothetical protein
MPTSTNLALPYIEAAQAQKHVTHNDALSLLDALVQLAVIDRDLATPPGSPSNGQRYIVAATPTGAWVGHVGHVAAWQDGAWLFTTPLAGFLAYVVDEAAFLMWNGSAWTDFGATITALQNLTRLGLGTTADATNPFTAKLNNALWVAKTVAEGGDGNLRYKLSKESAAKTLSLLFQNNFSGRAEVGLTGDDDFHFKVSPDGAAWFEALTIDRASGRVSFPSSAIRQPLLADTTYYVRTDGNDSNNGLSNTAGGAFLTVQRAINKVYGEIDLNGFNATIQVADGTYNGTILVDGPPTGKGIVLLQGNVATPANVLLNNSGGNAIAVQNGARLNLASFKVTSSAHGVLYSLGATGTGAGLDFGACGNSHIAAATGASFQMTAAYSISAGAVTHMNANNNAFVGAGFTAPVTISGTPAFSAAALRANQDGTVLFNAPSVTGSATGKKYDAASRGSILAPNGQEIGSLDGTLASDGIYVKGSVGALLQLPAFVRGTYSAAQLFYRWMADRAVTFKATLPGSVASAGVASTGDVSFTLKKNGASIGTIRFNASASATISFASDVSFAVADVLTVEAPASADATLADVAISLRALW